MPWISGSRYGSFEVLEPLGAGGMGEVYRARDLRLDRTVALKVLPDGVLRDPERLARFEREARVLASLHHSSIASIFGLETVDGHPALILELVEGITLAERVDRGRCAVEEAIAIGRQIADALESAHARGIVHRDLKPANVKLTSDGTAKVLDFGLAMILAPDSASPEVEPPTASNLTVPGIVLGTPGYMAPEQAAGQPLDRRADLWALGVILWELLTGRRLFQRGTLAETLAAVLQADVDWSALPPDTPPSLRRLLRRTLQRDPRQRLRDAADARLELDEALEEIRAGGAGAPSLTTRGWRALVWGAGGLALGLLLALLLPRGGGETEAPGPVVRSELPLAEGVQLDGWGSPVLAISPDGSTLAYVGLRPGEQTRIYVQDLTEGRTQVVPDSETGEGPFFSPDGKDLGFAVGTSLAGAGTPQLRRFSIESGLTQKLCDLADYFGATWGEDGSIYFIDHALGGIVKVPASGGTAENVLPRFRTEGREAAATLLWPQLLPGGRHLLVVDITALDRPRPAVVDLRTRELRHLGFEAIFARYVPSGHLVFVERDQTLKTVGFDAAAGNVRGEPVARIRQVSTTGNDASAVALSDSGTLVYTTGYLRQSLHELFQPVRAAAASGRSEPLRIKAAEFTRTFRLSPDGRQALGSTTDGSLWVFDMARGTGRKLYQGAFTDYPAWSPDGRWVAFTDYASGKNRALIAPLDGSAPPKPVFQSAAELHTSDFTHDGKGLLLTLWPQPGEVGEGVVGVWVLPLNGSGAPRRIVSGTWPAISPDGRWIAYVDIEGRKLTPHVLRADGTGLAVPVADIPAREPRWARDGSELYFRNGDEVVAVSVKGTDHPEFGEPQRILALTDVRGYDPAPGTREFVGLLRSPGSGIQTRIQLITHWSSTIEEEAGAAGR